MLRVYNEGDILPINILSFEGYNSIMKRIRYVWLFIFVLMALFIGDSHIGEARVNNRQEADVYGVISLVNQVRAVYGLPAYSINNALMSAAQSHSNYQASIGNVTHTGAGGSQPVDRAMAAGYGAGIKVYVSENIYGGTGATAQQVVNWWQGDSLHLNTMINSSYTDVGAGVAVGGGVNYYTLDVGYISGSPANPGVTPGSEYIPPPGSTPKATAPVFIPIQTATPGADGEIIHVVQSGQALWNIAAVYNVTLDDLLALNDLTKDSYIFVGEKILVKAGTSGSAHSLGTEETPEAVSSTSPTTPLQTTPKQTMLSLPALEQISTVTKTPAEFQNPAVTEPTSDIILNIIAALVLVGTLLIIVGSVAGRNR
jgi:LysM repeat protein